MVRDHVCTDCARVGCRRCEPGAGSGFGVSDCTVVDTVVVQRSTSARSAIDDLERPSGKPTDPSLASSARITTAGFTPIGVQVNTAKVGEAIMSSSTIAKLCVNYVK